MMLFDLVSWQILYIVIPEFDDSKRCFAVRHEGERVANVKIKSYTIPRFLYPSLGIALSGYKL